MTQIEIAYVLASFAGMLAHGVKRWASGETRCVTDYFTTDFPRNTVAAVMVNITAIVTALHLGLLDAVPFEHAIYLGFLQGLGADAGLNRGKRVVWDSAERQRRLRR